MKKRAVWALAAVLLLASGCGGGQKGGDGAEDPDVALDSLYAGMAEECGWEEGYMADVEGELLESYYPGLSEIPAKQLVAKIPAMSSDVNEVVLIQCDTEEDAEEAGGILQARIDAQVDGGAWYPESLEAWKAAKVLREGTYTALIASGAHQEELEEQFRSQFR
ncbi:DUF4358 domain-containing protein [uncultured Oscillibacter sp.]|uniref:DUF4358 domain-containing protein n=1 Tax=uncultured Oscillibacter sp. TaxID=876091 RepID=UPI0025FF5246|nr:DUF4358 domain-containing protein [uncultured Oscillibacter sp.]